MSQIIEQQNTSDSAEKSDAVPCVCEKKTCAIGIASIVIGISGFILAHLL